MIKILKLIFILTALCLSANAQKSDNYRGNLINKGVKINGGGLPIVFIDTQKQMIEKDSYILAYMKIINNEDGKNYSDTINHPDQTVDYTGWVAIKYRGNSSFSLSEKKPYAIQTLKSDTLPDNGGAKDKVKILGMGKDNKWVMLAPWSDRSMIRDALAYNLERQWLDYTPQTRFCEVILDGTYYGVYIFTEKVSQGKKRLNMHDPGSDEGDMTGDYIVKVDRADGDAYYTSNYSPWASFQGGTLYSDVKYIYVFPDDDEFESMPGSRIALHDEIDKMEDAFAADDYQDSEKGYRKYIDVNSFIDYMLITEMSMNIDGYRLSTFMYKYSDARAKAEGLDSRWKMSVWDYNIAFGNADYYNGDQTDCWQYELNLHEPYESEVVPFYWYRMLNDPWYVAQMKARWQAYRDNNFSLEAINEEIDSLSNRLIDSGATKRNEQAWGVFTRYDIWPCPKNNVFSYNAEITYTKNWIKKRLEFMDEALLDGSSAGIDGVMNRPVSSTGAVYNIHGQRVGKDYRGIVIKDGRKTMLR